MNGIKKRLTRVESGQNPNSSSIQVIYRRIQDIKPDPKNPRVHTPKQIKQIARSIQSFGYTMPILLDQHDNIVAGHGRYLACQQLGYAEVATISLSNLSPEQVKAYRIADDQLTINSVWNDQLVAEQLQELSLLDLDFSIDVIGFDTAEIDIRIESLSVQDEAKPDPADLLPPQTEYAVSELGDLWLMDQHRLLNGNCLLISHFKVLMDGKLGDAVILDPPFNVPMVGHVTGNGKLVHRPFPMANGEMTDQEFTAFLSQIFALLIKHTRDGSVHYVAIDWRHAEHVIAAGKAYSKMLNVCVWSKSSPSQGSFYRSQHEWFYVFRNGNSTHINNVQLGKYGRSRSNIWQYEGAQGLRHSEEGNLLQYHPTCKPVRLVADAILDCTNRKDIVIDTCLGSGTTLIAAERVGRYCYGMELDSRYCDTAIRRWEAITGQDAIHAPTGQTFKQREHHAKQAYLAATTPTKKSGARRKTHHG